MPGNYAGTEVPVTKSQDELRKLLIKFGAEQFTFGQGPDWAGLEFIHGGHLARFRCPIRPFDSALASRPHKTRLTPATWPEAEAQRVWRVLVWSVKTRCVAIEEELETVEQAFLAHVVDPATNRTLYQRLQDAIESGAFKLGGPGLPALGRGDG